MTDDAQRAKADAIEVIREIIRRSGHEIRNALNGVAVNVEVVRSRVARAAREGGGNSGPASEIATFAERAGSQIGEAGALTDGLLALVGNLLPGEADGTLHLGTGVGGGSRIELMIYGDRADRLVSDIKLLANRIGIGVERGPQRIILTILPKGKSHSKT